MKFRFSLKIPLIDSRKTLNENTVVPELIIQVYTVCFHYIYSSSGIHFSNKNETVSLDNKLVGEDIPTESFEQMKATNPIPLPPRSQLRQAPSDNASTMPPQKADSSRYAQGGGNSRANTGPKTLPHVLPKRGRPRPPSEEDIYECPD